MGPFPIIPQGGMILCQFITKLIYYKCNGFCQNLVDDVEDVDDFVSFDWNCSYKNTSKNCFKMLCNRSFTIFHPNAWSQEPTSNAYNWWSCGWFFFNLPFLYVQFSIQITKTKWQLKIHGRVAGQIVKSDQTWK